MDRLSRHFFDAQNFEMAPRCLESLCTPTLRSAELKASRALKSAQVWCEWPASQPGHCKYFWRRGYERAANLYLYLYLYPYHSPQTSIPVPFCSLNSVIIPQPVNMPMEL